MITGNVVILVFALLPLVLFLLLLLLLLLPSCVLLLLVLLLDICFQFLQLFLQVPLLIVTTIIHSCWSVISFKLAESILSTVTGRQHCIPRSLNFPKFHLSCRRLKCW